MSFTPSDPADFTPSMGAYKTLQPFRYWCQKVLPLVYDDSLSYYELLCKVIDYLNKTMEDVETLHTDVDNIDTAFGQLQNYVNVNYTALVDFVNNYFDNLNVQEEINNKLDVMASDGTLDALLLPYFNEYKGEINEIVEEQNETLNTQNEKIEVLEGRMDTFASLPDGSTAGDAELLDIRIGANGTVYSSAGNAVRGQVTALQNKIDNVVDTVNSITGGTTEEQIAVSTDYTLQKYISESGTIGTSSDLLGSYTFSATKGTKVKAYAKNMASPLAIIALVSDTEWNNIEVVGTLSPSEEGWAEYTLTKDSYVVCSSRVSGYSPQIIALIPYQGSLEEIEESIQPAIDDTLSEFSETFEIGTYENNNIADLSLLVSGKRYTSDGSLEVFSSASYEDKYIPVDGNKFNYYRACYIKSQTTPETTSIRFLCYDENKNLLSYQAAANGAIPYGTKYVRYSTFNNSYAGTPNIEESLMIFILKDATSAFSLPQSYVDYDSVITKIYDFNHNLIIRPEHKIVVNGDSITYGYNPNPSSQEYADLSAYGYQNYCRIACDELGYTVDNYSIVNSTLTDYTGDGVTGDPLCVRYTDMSNTADFVYIAIGTNDATNSSVSLGQMSDRTGRTFYGALHILCQGLREKYGAIPIVFATPIKRVYSVDTMTPVPMDDYIEAIKEVCGYYGIPVFDMNVMCRINAWLAYDISNYIPDGIHPNLDGHKRMAIAFKNLMLSWLNQSV